MAQRGRPWPLCSKSTMVQTSLCVAHQRCHSLPCRRHFEPVPGGHDVKAPEGEQLLLHKAAVPLPVGHPHGNQAPLLHKWQR